MAVRYCFCVEDGLNVRFVSRESLSASANLQAILQRKLTDINCCGILSLALIVGRIPFLADLSL